MLRLRSPQSLGINIPILSSIPILGPVINNVESLLTGDVCNALPVDLIPGLKQVVTKFGCSPIGRDALIVELNAVGGPVVAAVGAATVATCLCQGKLGPIPNVPTPAPSSSAEKIFSNPIVWAGAAALVLGLVLFSSKKGGDRSLKTTATTSYTPTSSTVSVI